MIFSKSITFDGEEIGRAIVSTSPVSDLAADESVFIEKLRAGDAAAFDVLVDRHSGGIYALLFRLTENEEDARDLTQDTFLRALRSMNGFRGEAGLKTWLYRIAINESRNRFRWWKRRKRGLTISLDATIGDSDTPLSDMMEGRSVNPEEAALMRERENALKSALMDIGDLYREAVILCDIEGLTYEETAVALGVGIGTVKSRISRGRDELRQKLKDF